MYLPIKVMLLSDVSLLPSDKLWHSKNIITTII